MNLSQRQSKQRKMRRKLLKQLLKKIRSGKLNSKEPLLEEIYSLTQTPREAYLSRQQQNDPTERYLSPRATREYVSPTDNSSYNTSRYMTIGEIGSGTPNVTDA